MVVYEISGEGGYETLSHSFSAYGDTSMTIKEFVLRSMFLHFHLSLSKENGI
jgi:hypothetical protein